MRLPLISVASPRTGEIAARSDFAGLQWGSTCNSLEIFPQLNVTWKELKAEFLSTGKPIGDLGASCSTIAAEGMLRGLPVVPVDLQVSFPISKYSLLVRDGLNTLSRHYSGELSLASGMEMASPIHPQHWERALSIAIENSKSLFIRADLSAIPLPDRFFSVSLVSDAVPKHSASLDEFLATQLPEILRVTDKTARIFPIAMFKELEGTLKLTSALYADESACKKIKEVAARCGFNFRLEHSEESPLDQNQRLGVVPALGIFERI